MFTTFITHSRLNKVFVCLVVITIILFIRKTDAFTNPQFWAEDGAVFFLDQYHDGAVSIFQPYGGYLHFAPRLIAIIADGFPYPYIPSIYNYLSLAGLFLVVLNIFSLRLEIENKFLFAVATVLIPHPTNEVFMNITNLQWILALLIVITLLKNEPSRQYGKIYSQIINDLVILVICGLTGPFIIFLLPVFAVKWFYSRTRHSGILLTAACLVASIQIYCIATTLSIIKEQTLITDLNIWAKIVGQKTFGMLFFGRNTAYIIPVTILLALLVIFFIFLVVLSLSDKKKYIFLYTAFVILILTFYKHRAVPHRLLEEDYGLRYFYIPYVMITWFLISINHLYEKWKRSVVRILLVFILVSALSSGFHSKPFHDYNWKYYSRKIGKEPHLVIPINPKGWAIPLDEKPYETLTEYDIMPK